MIRSVLPSTRRRYARQAKAMKNRAARRFVRFDLRAENFWCEAITEGMTTREALESIRAILPDSLIGDHAYGHWETHCRYRRDRQLPTYRERRGREVQSFVDSTAFRLRRALVVDPTLHARINAEIKRRKLAGEARRLLAGVHEVEEFVRAIARYMRHDAPDPFAVERAITLELIEQIERQKGGRKAALLLRSSSVAMLRRLELLRTFDEPDELTGIVDQDRQMLRADAEGPALIFERDERHGLGCPLAEDAVGLSVHRCMMRPDHATSKRSFRRSRSVCTCVRAARRAKTTNSFPMP
jgi:hypothetical protein